MKRYEVHLTAPTGKVHPAERDVIVGRHITRWGAALQARNCLRFLIKHGRDDQVSIRAAIGESVGTK